MEAVGINVDYLALLILIFAGILAVIAGVIIALSKRSRNK